MTDYGEPLFPALLPSTVRKAALKTLDELGDFDPELHDLAKVVRLCVEETERLSVAQERVVELEHRVAELENFTRLLNESLTEMLELHRRELGVEAARSAPAYPFECEPRVVVLQGRAVA